MIFRTMISDILSTGLRRISPCALAGCLALACQTAPDWAGRAQTESESATHLLVTGGTVVTMDDEGTVIPDGAVAIEDGRITAVGPRAELQPAHAEAYQVSADGGVIMPGLINAHTHVPMVLFRGLADDLELMDWLENHIFPAEAEHVDEEFVRVGTRLACLEMLRGGITTFVDGYYFEDAIAEEVEACGMRAVLGSTLIDFPAPDNETWEEAIAYARAFIEKWRGHSTITAALGPHSSYTVSAEHLVEAHAIATALDVPLLIHLAEDRGEIERVTQATGMTSVDYLESLGILDQRVLAAHMVFPSPSEIELLAHRDVGVAHCPQSNMKIAAGVAPVAAMIEAGVAVGLGTDGAASNNDLNLWEEIDTAAKLAKVTTGDPTVLDARQAIAMATIEGARAIGMAADIGSLEVGKRADLIVVSADGFHQQPQPAALNPYSLLAYATKASDVRHVIVEGRLVVENGRVLTLDADTVLEEATAIRRRITDGSSH
ncbi:MAG: amidohydrolase [Acidobacteria bacterium]|nr:amidohydrolase [Acidobacteriota bacterium]